MNLVENIGEGFLAALGKGIGGVAIRATQVAGSEADKDAWQPCKGALPLQTQINFVDDQISGHLTSIEAQRLLGNDGRGQEGF